LRNSFSILTRLLVCAGLFLGYSAASRAETPPTAAGTANPSAAASAAKLTPAQQEFASAFIAAANAQSLNALRKLVAPEALACYTDQTESQPDIVLKPHLQLRFPLIAR
jgi:hypothetical protein